MSSQSETFHILQPRPYLGLLSLVIPLYNEEAVDPFLRPAVEQFSLEVSVETEVVLVNDGSTDKTVAQIVVWATEDPRIKVIHLSRNFGHQISCTAGVDCATGDAAVVLDADLQQPLPVIHEMIGRHCEGCDVAYATGLVREGKSWFKKFLAWFFYRLVRTLVYRRLRVDAGGFRLISRNCLDGLRRMWETHHFLRGMVAWVGYAQIAIPCKRREGWGQVKIPATQNAGLRVDRGNLIFDLAVAHHHDVRPGRHAIRSGRSPARHSGTHLQLVYGLRLDGANCSDFPFLAGPC